MSMRALGALFAATCSGCFTTWTTTQLSGTQRVWDEGVREQAVPLDGVEERLAVEMPLNIMHESPPPTTTTTAATIPAEPAAPPRALPFALTCVTTQRGQDEVYHSAFRYGKSWKKGAAIMFLVEGLSGSALLFLGERSTSDVVWGSFLAADAVGSAAIFFIPRKEIYRRDVVEVVTPIRDDCPAGLALEIDGEAYPVDAAGRIGEVGEAALDDWMQAPSGVVRLTLPGRSADVILGAAERCTWNRARQRTADPGCTYASVPPQTASASIVVPAGTLTRIE
jgi:hypothetical protein